MQIDGTNFVKGVKIKEPNKKFVFEPLIVADVAPSFVAVTHCRIERNNQHQTYTVHNVTELGLGPSIQPTKFFRPQICRIISLHLVGQALNHCSNSPKSSWNALSVMKPAKKKKKSWKQHFMYFASLLN